MWARPPRSSRARTHAGAALLAFVLRRRRLRMPSRPGCGITLDRLIGAPGMRPALIFGGWDRVVAESIAPLTAPLTGERGFATAPSRRNGP